MSAKNIYVCRHAERIDFIDKRWVLTAEKPCDPPLSPNGFEQARQLAKYVANIQPKITHLYVSPYLRTIQTALEIIKEINRDCKSFDEMIKIRIEPGYTEFHLNREWNAQTMYRPLQQLPEVAANLELFDMEYEQFLGEDSLLSEGEESRVRFRQRLLKTLTHTLDIHKDDCNILIVTHAGPLIEAVRALLSLPNLINPISNSDLEEITTSKWNMSPIRTGVASLSHLIQTENQWTLTKNGLASFLQDGEVKMWVFPDEKHLYQK